METETSNGFKEVTADQQILIAKILRSSKLSDREYRQLSGVLQNQVVTRYDASILIDFVLAALKFRRHFLNKKHRAYKKCAYCGSRKNVERFEENTEKHTRVWVCDLCALNLRDKVLPVKLIENKPSNEAVYGNELAQRQQAESDENE